LLVSGPAGPRDQTGIWVVPVGGGVLRKLQEDARGAVLSPDNSQIAFVRDSVQEIWLVSASGEGARRLLVRPRGYGLSEKLAWSPEGQRIAFEATRRIGSEVTIQSYNLKTSRTTTILSDPQLEDFCWARDGRLIYSRRENSPNQRSSNLWEISVDPGLARVGGKPRRLTNWSDFNFGSLAVSADGKRLSFVRVRSRSNVYVAELNGNARLTKPRRLTFDEWIDWPTGWSRDSKAVLFHSDRNGVLNIFQQALTGREPRLIVTGQDEAADSRLSPDGRWILYLAWREDEEGNRTGEGRLMRGAVAARTIQMVFPITGYTGEAADEQFAKRPVPAAEGDPRFRCPSMPQSPCVLSEKLENQIVFTAFDPLQGRKAELARIDVDRSLPAFWDLSSDGRWIAVGTTEETSGRIRLLPLSGQPGREISAGKWTNLTSMAWASDGKALFVTGWASKNPPLLRVSLDGKAQLLYSGRYYLEEPVPSPDGRYLAFGDVLEDSNAWVVENLANR
jgi:Tol biopolymer transport system component